MIVFTPPGYRGYRPANCCRRLAMSVASAPSAQLAIARARRSAVNSSIDLDSALAILRCSSTACRPDTRPRSPSSSERVVFMGGQPINNGRHRETAAAPGEQQHRPIQQAPHVGCGAGLECRPPARSLKYLVCEVFLKLGTARSRTRTAASREGSNASSRTVAGKPGRLL